MNRRTDRITDGYTTSRMILTISFPAQLVESQRETDQKTARVAELEQAAASVVGSSQGATYDKVLKQEVEQEGEDELENFLEDHRTLVDRYTREKGAIADLK